jgi:hypothetical protein
MPATKAQIAAVQRLSIRAQGDTGQLRGTDGVSARPSAGAGDISGGPTRQPGRHHRVPWTPLGRWPGRPVGGAGRFSATPCRETDAAVAQAAGLAGGAYAIR